MPTAKRRGLKSSYTAYAQEQCKNRTDLANKAIADIETFVWIGSEYKQVDTIHSWTRRNKATDSQQRMIHQEFELLVEEGAVPIFAKIGNRRFFPTDFLDVVCTKMIEDLSNRMAMRQNTNSQVAKVASELAKNPELLQIIAELITESQAKQAI